MPEKLTMLVAIALLNIKGINFLLKLPAEALGQNAQNWHMRQVFSYTVRMLHAHV